MRVEDEVRRFEDQIFRKQKNIDKIAETYHGLNIKTSILGQDAKLNEYWYFKEENTKLFIKREVASQTPAKIEDVKMDCDDEVSEEASTSQMNNRFKWYFIEDEESME